MTLNQRVPTVGPLTAAELTAAINVEYAELYKRSFAVIGSPAGTNNYTGSIPLGRTLEDGNGFIFRVPNANTSACDLNGISMVSPTGAALQTGQLQAGMEIVMIYNAASNALRVHTPMTGGSAPILRVYATSGTFTWTRPAGLRAVKVRVQAAGGGAAGRGSSADLETASGAGSGGYGERTIPFALLPSSVAITVGAGGLARSHLFTSGPTAGGNSSFGSFVTTNGGQPGLWSGTAGQNHAGGVGGVVGSNGDINMPGFSGSSNWGAANSADGANSPFGGAGGARVLISNTTGNNGVFGGGGSPANRGSFPASQGGAGGDGIVTVEEIY